MKKPAAENHEQNTECVIDPDLLAFLIGTPLIIDGNFVEDFCTPSGPAKNFSMLFPATRYQFVGFDQITPVQQIAGIDVRKSGVEKHVENQRNQFVPDLVPEKLNPGIAARHESAAHNDVGTEFQRRIEKIAVM